MLDHSIEINGSRLSAALEDLATIGRTDSRGVTRIAATDADKAGRDQLVSWMREAGLDVRIDAIGNLFGVRSGCDNDLAPVMVGSHIDSVVDGGRLDGPLGVLAGIEVVRRLNEEKVATNRPLIVASFTNEEGIRFQPDMMGSLVYAGGMSLEQALSSTDERGCRLGDELTRIGYAGDMVPGSIRPHAFLELHIEQGPILDTERIPIGVVSHLQGISWTEISLQGQANHAGTTPMRLRCDAGYAAASIAVFCRKLASELGGDQVATCGRIEFWPNAINVVPGRARVTVDLRNPLNEGLQLAEQRLREFVHRIAESENLGVNLKQLVRFDPVRFDADIVDVIEEQARALDLTSLRMTSGAGHDAQMMARICRTAMIFAPSIDGISHNPKENTSPKDITNAANVLLRTVLRVSEDRS